MKDFWVSKLKILVQKDLDLKNVLREMGILNDGYHSNLEQLHILHAKKLRALIDKNGFPVLSNAGEEGVKYSWLIIHHAISLPEFMKDCLFEMRLAATQRDYPLDLLAYTEDLISYLEGKPQIYGTHMEWFGDELRPSKIGDEEFIEFRRSSFGLGKLSDQLFNPQHERPPKDLSKKMKDFEAWRRRVGWQSEGS